MMGIDWGYALGQGILGGANAVNQIAGDEEKKRALIEAEKRASDQRMQDHERILALNEVMSARAEQRKIETNRQRGGEVDAAVQSQVKGKSIQELRDLYGDQSLTEADIAPEELAATSKPSRADVARIGADEAAKRGFEDMAKERRGILATETADENKKSELERRIAGDLAKIEHGKRVLDLQSLVNDGKIQLAEAKAAKAGAGTSKYVNGADGDLYFVQGNKAVKVSGDDGKPIATNKDLSDAEKSDRNSIDKSIALKTKELEKVPMGKANDATRARLNTELQEERRKRSALTGQSAAVADGGGDELSAWMKGAMGTRK